VAPAEASRCEAKSWLPLEKRDAVDKRWFDDELLLCEKDRRSGVSGGDAMLCVRGDQLRETAGLVTACCLLFGLGGTGGMYGCVDLLACSQVLHFHFARGSDTSSISCRFSDARAVLVCVGIPKEAGRLVRINKVGSSDRPGCCQSFCHLLVRRGWPYP
jgi:hypothetical protein